MIRIGLVGCGSAGRSHLQAMLGTRGLKVVAVCDINRNFAERAAQTAKASCYTDAETMMKKEPLNAVAIITTASAHYQIAKLAARYNLHVLCEKPLTLIPREGKELIGIFRRKKLLLAVTFTYRYLDTARTMKNLIDAGTIGKIVEMRHIAWFGKPAKYLAGTEAKTKYDRLYQPDIRGILFDCGVHTFDLFHWFSGEKYRKFIGMGVCHKGYAFPDSGTILSEMSGGIRCFYEHGPLPYYLGDVEGIGMGIIAVAGAHGSLIWKILNKKKKDKYYSEFQINTAAKQEILELPHYAKGRDRQYRDFVTSLAAGTLGGSFPAPEEANYATWAAARAVDAVMENIVRKSGGKINCR